MTCVEIWTKNILENPTGVESYLDLGIAGAQLCKAQCSRECGLGLEHYETGYFFPELGKNC